MSDATHTPGPWCTGAWTSHGIIIFKENPGAYDTFVGYAQGYPQRENATDEDRTHFLSEAEAEANATLIAAAPELLEALEAIVCALNVGRDRLGRLDADVMSGEALRQLAIRHQVSAGRDRMEQIKNVAEVVIRKARGGE